jgi:hypothetical protein
MARKAQCPRTPWDDARALFTHQFKALAAALQKHRHRAGKPVHPHVFSNEAKLIKRLVNDGDAKINPDEMTLEQLLRASALLVEDTHLLDADRDYQERKTHLTAFCATQWNLTVTARKTPPRRGVSVSPPAGAQVIPP